MIQLLQKILKISNNELELAFSLLINMRYTKGPNTGKILLKYLQRKAMNYIKATIYKTFINKNKSQKLNKSQQRRIVFFKKKIRSLHGKIGRYKQIHKIQQSKKNKFISNLLCI